MTDTTWLDEVLRECVNHAYDVMDAKSFADPYAQAKATILTKLNEARKDELISFAEQLDLNGDGLAYFNVRMTRLNTLNGVKK